MKKWILLAGLFVALSMTVACSEKPLDEVAARVDTNAIVVDDNKFQPRVVEVAPGTEITWSFEDDKKHDAVGDGWGSEPMSSGTFSHRFSEPGTYDYKCTLHPNMTGRIIVRDE